MSCNWQGWLAKIRKFSNESLTPPLLNICSPTPFNNEPFPIISTSVSSKPMVNQFVLPFSHVIGDHRPYLPVKISNINFLALFDSGSSY